MHVDKQVALSTVHGIIGWAVGAVECCQSFIIVVVGAVHKLMLGLAILVVAANK
jgi:hypothetical protein